MWKLNDIQDGESYRVALKVAPTGSRIFELIPSSCEYNDYDFVTPVIDDHTLLRSRNYERIVTECGIEGDTDIFVDAHGIWMTASEIDQLDSDVEDIQWYKGVAPFFAPK
ncbi:hypothetical protein JO972_16545 [Verrucomicrobiaceae bacterium 5K15]|uniref:Uncharacterized protein n=1 Tax=Oceaniferula flava TaxID=2800421 RepID=A0AAE2SHQ3_9BACT|nr:hypothetical protein [Oceaniferula flavus]MBK1856581.1 hypothetical protein [Oceaniferula flavus]MBM1137888.1 hypothetical protein [Oceaniferula flavus]